jgi:hypothetical protein
MSHCHYKHYHHYPKKPYCDYGYGCCDSGLFSCLGNCWSGFGSGCSLIVIIIILVVLCCLCRGFW